MDRSSWMRDQQMESELPRSHERESENALVERERDEIMTRVHKTRLLCGLIKRRLLFN